MAYAYARVGSLTKNGDEIVTGATTAFVEPATGAQSVTVTFNGQVIVFSPGDSGSMEQDDPESNTGLTLTPPVYGTPTAQQLAQSAANAPTITPTGNAITQVSNSSIPLATDCSNVTGNVNYSYQLSNNFILSQVSTKAAFSHTIEAQHGLTVAQIICNLKGVATNCLETVAAKYGAGNMLITSGFRPARGTSPNSAGTPSQHELGQACDVQIPSLSNDDFWAAAQWVMNNVPYDQFILEKASGRPWMHLSFNRSGLRKKVLTWLGGTNYIQGLQRTF